MRQRYRAVLATLVLTLCACSTPPPAQPPRSEECAPQGGYQIKITIDGIGCADAYAVAQKYDLSGPKNQQIGSFTCYSGTAYTKPMIFQCISDKAQFAVSTTQPRAP